MAKKSEGACEALRQMILRNPAWTRAEVEEKAKAAGNAVSPSTAKTVHHAVLSTLHSLDRLGLYSHDGLAEKATKSAEKASKPAKKTKTAKAKV